ncbi:MAG: hypothetical protein PUP93_25125 [Rhizonema sp. NSF051]|nr:hypothetical protein [Rhizonema sp. NSF051]
MSITRIQLNPEGWNLNILSARVATITDPVGNRKVSYFGFDTKEKAVKFQQWLIENEQCSAASVRKAERSLMLQKLETCQKSSMVFPVSLNWRF